LIPVILIFFVLCCIWYIIYWWIVFTFGLYSWQSFSERLEKIEDDDIVRKKKLSLIFTLAIIAEIVLKALPLISFAILNSYLCFTTLFEFNTSGCLIFIGSLWLILRLPVLPTLKCCLFCFEFNASTRSSRSNSEASNYYLFLPKDRKGDP